MNQKRWIPFWRKFLIRKYRDDGGGFLWTMLAGFAVIQVQWKYPKDLWAHYDTSGLPRVTSVSVGFIPWKIEPGGSFQSKTLFSREIGAADVHA
jgi:ABC-type polysaccharide/polyol phosphate export permease